MHPKEVFLRQLEIIRQYAGAEKLGIFHDHLSVAFLQQTNLDDESAIITGNLADLEQGLSELNTTLDLSAYAEAEQIIWVAKHNVLFRVPDSDENTKGSNAQNKQNQKGTFVPRKHNPDSGYLIAAPWLHLIFAGEIPDWFNDAAIKSSAKDNPSNIQHLCRLVESTNQLFKLVLEHIELSSDPLTMLCSRSVLQSKVTRLGETHSIGLIMLHCTDFNQINKKFGHEYGDNVIREIASTLQPVTRENDILSRFSGALFGIACSVEEEEDLTTLAQKLQNTLHKTQYLDGAINLTFNIGAALVKSAELFKSSTERASTLINRADQALTAAQQEKVPSIIVWSNDDFSLHQQQFNYLGGIFTADTVTDYRNMLLLWDLSSLIADKHEFSHLLQSVVQRLAQTFEFSHAGIISDSEPQTDNNLSYSVDEHDNAVALNAQGGELRPVLRQMQKVVASKNKPSERFIDNALILVFPLQIDSSDCFFISGVAEKFQVKHDTKVLFSGLIRQLGKALRRSRLEEQLNKKLETQNEQLQHELTQLKEGIQESSIIFQSEIMHKLMKQAKRAASTDTTVLVTGESGTGKERLIHALHTLGPRAKAPFVIIDCGSIPETLIESELFGYVKGAFTGAQNSSKGKIADAEGGVLVLDEIGELPLQMQTKLLRFVQEKHYTPVGGNKLLNVDIKIIAVTNRDLAEEVDRGTFRRDLYYRLNVLTLHNPPLRQRTEDIPLLSQHFLLKFAEQFSSGKKTLSADAMSMMQRYTWPGNIREMENRLMQAVLLCESETIEWDLLNIDDDVFVSNPPATQKPQITSLEASEMHRPTTSEVIPKHTGLVPTAPAAPHSMIESTVVTTLDPSKHVTSELVLNNLETTLGQIFSSFAQHPQFYNTPVGTWVEDDLILKTFYQSDKKMRTTAARLHISQSKARRRVDSLLASEAESSSSRPANWAILESALLPIAKGEVLIGDCLAEVKLVVLKVVLEKATFNMAQASEMMGVSEPTFYKLKKSLGAKSLQAG